MSVCLKYLVLIHTILIAIAFLLIKKNDIHSFNIQNNSKTLKQFQRQKLWTAPLVDIENLWDEYNNIFENNKLAEHENFVKNIEKIIKHNNNATEYYKMGVNQFTATNLKDKERRLTVYKPQSNEVPQVNSYSYLGLGRILKLPPSFDWRDYNIINPRVRDQGDCGSCWAISTVSSLEAIYSWHAQDSVELSEQELIDCSKKDFGCDGGWFESALDYVSRKPSQWLTISRDYPYSGKKNEYCRAHDIMSRFRVVGGEKIRQDDEEALREALITKGPLPVALHVTANMYLYNSGIFWDPSCNKNSVNHAVLLVGYGEDERLGPYWILKNSWGHQWGEDGHFKIMRGRNMCGIASYALAPKTYFS